MKTISLTVQLTFDDDVTSAEVLDVIQNVKDALTHWQNEAGLAPEGNFTQQISVHQA
jgi:hypothetical protein